MTLTRIVLVQWIQEKIGGEELKSVSIDSHSDVSRIIGESRVVGLWLEGHEMLEFFCF